MKKKTIWIISILLLIIVVLLVLKKKGVIGGEEGTKVAIENAELRTIIETVNASGKIYPEVEVKISSDVSGEITELTVAEGDSVQRGQVVARVYADIYNIQEQQAAAVVNQQRYQVENTQAQLEGLRSAMQQAESQYNRQKKLLDGKVISRQEFEVAENAYLSAKANYNAALRGIDAGNASVASAKANLQRAAKDLSRTTIVSPMSGIVSLLNVKKGERVVGTAQMAGTEMMRIADMNRLEIRVDVPENDVPKVHLGDSALISVDAYLDRKFKGLVYQIASSNTGAVNASSSASSNEVTNYKVYIRLLPESYADLIDPAKPRSFPFRPGMTASADIQTKVHTNVVSVPINAVTTRGKDEKKEGDAAKKKDGEASKEPKGTGMDDKAPAADGDEKDVVVFVYDKATGTVKKLKVETGIQDTRYIEVTKGLSKGQVIVSEPYNVIFRILNDGMKVLVVDKAKLFEAKN
ncbi:MAG TPA: efflux RND transporter periplasmic adaptor subunit [Phnomibacter sp.]|nr:efflux RND transporter periplasmic adaptor subunit [Phnomibacter sp.]